MGSVGQDIPCQPRNSQTLKMGVSHHHRGARCLLLSLDVDECSEGLSQCGPFSVCLNVPGSYRCECRGGYQPAGDGQACVRKCWPQSGCAHLLCPTDVP